MSYTFHETGVGGDGVSFTLNDNGTANSTSSWGSAFPGGQPLFFVFPSWGSAFVFCFSRPSSSRPGGQPLFFVFPGPVPPEADVKTKNKV